MTQEQTLTRLLTNKAKLSESRIDHQPLPEAAEGEAIFKINRVALTTNNITYALLGESMQYWDFFPSGVDGWGQMPAWGFADVVSSKVAGVEPGERFYGYFPIATHLRVQPVRVSSRGFHDGAPHRASLTSAYNQYARTATDPVYLPKLENYQILLRPLIITSFFGADFLEDNKFFGAKQLLISSASSKTAYGTAFCLALRRRAGDAVKVIGLTSPGNLAFTRSLGCYDEVLGYDDVPAALPDEPAVYVDFSGSAPLRAAVHERLADTLAYSCSVGATHWDMLGNGNGSCLPGPQPVLFFAPNQAKKRSGDWAPAGLQERLTAAWAAFMQPVTRADDPWLQVVRDRGTAAVEACYAALLDGRVRPQEGHILSL
jgi:hypothetical protein